jgi:hypothetical protein
MPTGCLNKERNVSGLAPTSSKKELGRVRIATAMYRSGTYEEKKIILYKLKVCSCYMLLIVTYVDSSNNRCYDVRAKIIYIDLKNTCDCVRG